MRESDITRPLYVQIPNDLDMRLRRYCLDRRCYLNIAVMEALELYLKTRTERVADDEN